MDAKVPVVRQRGLSALADHAKRVLRQNVGMCASWNENRLFWNSVSLSCDHRLGVLSKSALLNIRKSNAWASSCSFFSFSASD